MIIIPPVAGAVIGWLTNYVAIKMLFRPRKTIEVLGVRIQGLIPKRRKAIARAIASAIERQLLSVRDLAGILEGIDMESEIERTVAEVIEHRFKTGRIKNIPVVGLLTDNFSYHIKYYITRELLKHFDRKKGDIVNRFKENVDIGRMVTSKIDDLDIRGLETLLTDIIATELRHIEWIGGIMGFIIGLFQVLLIHILR